MSPAKHSPLKIAPLNDDEREAVSWIKRPAVIRDAKGQVVFRQDAVESPDFWSQTAIDVVASKYFRPQGAGGAQESSVRQLFGRVTQSLLAFAEANRRLDTASARALEERLEDLLVSQRAAFNSPVFFNAGLHWAYGSTSESPTHRHIVATGETLESQNGLENPQCSACFIQALGDRLDDIFRLAHQEARIFKFGSGSGTNFSRLRAQGEALSGGGQSSGLMSFLDVLDRGAGATKSGGILRRAAKMVCLDVDHPDIFDFISWKQKEEKKARVLVAAGYLPGLDGEAYRTVSGQNSNNSVRVTDEFMQAVAEKRPWTLRGRVDRRLDRTVPAQQIWSALAQSAWECSDPGLQFDSTIQRWHTCPMTAPIRSSNPCSEYMFIDDSACNLASLNLLKFWRDKSRTFDVAGFQGAIRALVIAQDLIVDYAGYPTPEIAKNSARLRPLGLGFANLGALLMTMGLPYDSDAARSWASAIASLLSSTAYQVSAEMASSWGAFAEFEINRKPFASVIEAHAQASESINWRVLGESQSAMQAAASSSWKAVRAAAQASGFRNAQVTAIAPTGTIGFMMDCDTTGIEPEFSLVKVKKLVGGGEMRLVNQCVSRSLLNLGYSVSQAEAITQHVRETGAVEGAPSIRPQHLRVFDCALSSSPNGAISSIGHLKMMAAVQPFISGAISKTVNLPSSATPEGVAEVYWQAWKMGLKAVSIYRDRSKIVQPLNLPSANPPCSLCGHETRLEGGCFICSNCGQTTACG